MCINTNHVFALAYEKPPKKSYKKPVSSVEILYDMIKSFSILKLVELDFSISQESVKELLTLLKSKKSLKTLKCTVVSPNYEQLLSDFVKHSSIETLVIKINIRLPGKHMYKSKGIIREYSKRLHSISVGLSVKELRKNNCRILPPSLVEFPIPAIIVQFVNEKQYQIKNCMESLTIAKFISIINHWMLSLKSLIYYLDPTEVHLYHPTSYEFYRTLFNCPQLKKVVLGNDLGPVALGPSPDVSQWVCSCAGLTDGLRIHQSLHTLSLYHSYYISELFDSLNNIHSLKSLKLGCLFDSQFDTDIRKYLLTNNTLEELELDHMNSVGWSGGLMQGLKHNTCLRKLAVFSKVRSFFKNYGVDKKASILIASMFRFNTTLCFFKCWLPMCIQPQHDLPLILEALSTNKTLRHLELFPMIYDYTLTTEETEALGKILSTNTALELFYFTVEITNCQPIIKGLLDNKTLKEFGIIEKTEKNIVILPDYIEIKSKIRVLDISYSIIND